MKIGNWFEMDSENFAIMTCFLAFFFFLSFWAYNVYNPNENYMSADKIKLEEKKIENEMFLKGYMKSASGQYIKVEKQ